MEAILTASVRKATGKGVAHRLRAEGQIPAVLYGKDNVKITLSSRDAQKILSDLGTSHLLKLKLMTGKKASERPVLIKDVQVDPVKGHLLHLDLYEVSMDHKVTLTVPVFLVGQGERTNDGSLVEQLMHEIEVTCLPNEIPEKIEVDISKITMNESISVHDITPPKGVEFATAPEETIVSAVPPRVDAEKTEEETGMEETTDTE